MLLSQCNSILLAKPKTSMIWPFLEKDCRPLLVQGTIQRRDEVGGLEEDKPRDLLHAG